MPLVATFRIEWFRVISDITRAGIPMMQIAKELGVSKSAVFGWKQGAEPKHGDGESLVALWCKVMAQDKSKLPMKIFRQQFILMQRHSQ